MGCVKHYVYGVFCTLVLCEGWTHTCLIMNMVGEKLWPNRGSNPGLPLKVRTLPLSYRATRSYHQQLFNLTLHGYIFTNKKERKYIDHYCSCYIAFEITLFIHIKWLKCTERSNDSASSEGHVIYIFIFEMSVMTL